MPKSLEVERLRAENKHLWELLALYKGDSSSGKKSAPKADGQKKTKRPMSEETKAKIAEKTRERWAKKKSGKD